MMVQLYWENGSYERLKTTEMSFADGYYLDDAMLDICDYREKGVRIERCFFASEQEDPDGEGLCVQEASVIVKPELLGSLTAVRADGMTMLARSNGLLRSWKEEGFVDIFNAFASEDAGDEDVTEDEFDYE